MSAIENKTGFIVAMGKSFCSGGFYREVASYWRGRAFIYLFIFLLLAWIPVIAVQAVRTVNFFDKVAVDFPTMTIKDGVASSYANQPYFIRNPQNQMPLIVVDTKANYQDFANSEATMLVNDKGISYKTAGGEIENSAFRPNTNVTVTSQWLRQQIHRMAPIFAILFYLFILPVSYAVLLISALIYAFFALMFANLLRRSLDYRQALILSLVAVTPAMGLFLIFWLFNILFIGEWTILLLIQIAYIFVAVQALPGDDQPLTKQ